MRAVLDRLGIGDQHEAHARRCVLVGPDDDLVLAPGDNPQPSACALGPGQPGQVVSVDDEVVQSDGYTGRMRGTPDCLARTRTVPVLIGCILLREAATKVRNQAGMRRAGRTRCAAGGRPLAADG